MALATAKRYTLDEFHQLITVGFFAENNQLELVHGEVFEKMTKGKRHAACSQKLLQHLSALIAGQAELRCQDPISLPPDSEPEPDFVVVKPREDGYFSAHPGSEDILLLIEVSDSSLEYDRTIKLALYAEAQIQHYWIVNLVDACLERYSQPYVDRQGHFGYALKQISLPDHVVTVPGIRAGELNLDRWFPDLKRF